MNEPEIKNETTEPIDFRAGYVAIIGEPNVGKSTLLNAILKQKISIVTDKPQTTRHKILGIHTTKHAQVVLLDTPGLLKPKYKLHEAMMKFADSAINTADVIFLIVDAVSANGHELALAALEGVKKPVFLLINKIDLLEKEKLAPLVALLSSAYPFKRVFPISALRRKGMHDLFSAAIQELPVHPPYYDSEEITEHSERFLVCEIIREKIFQQFREEIPYSTTVDIIEFKEKGDDKATIEAEIYVERDSQKAILIGKKGEALKRIGIKARKDIERLLGREVYLRLYVKVREKWRSDAAWLKRLGYLEQ